MAQKKYQGSAGSFVLGFLMGTGIGAIVALLKAPQSGEETRRKLQRATQEFRTEADRVVATTKEQLQQAKDELSQHAAEIRAETETALQKTKKVLQEGAEDVQQEAEEGAADVHQAVTTQGK